jgi:hypothetical protein
MITQSGERSQLRCFKGYLLRIQMQQQKCESNECL